MSRNDILNLARELHPLREQDDRRLHVDRVAGVLMDFFERNEDAYDADCEEAFKDIYITGMSERDH